MEIFRMKGIIWARVLIFVIALSAAIVGFLTIDSTNVKAPLLTLMGGSMILIAIVPDVIDLKRLGMFAGSCVALTGSWFWLETARSDPEYRTAEILMGTALGVLWLTFVSLSLYFLWHAARAGKGGDFNDNEPT